MLSWNSNFSRITGIRGMLVRSEDLASPDFDLDVQQLNLATLRERLPDPTVYMIICLMADVLIWALAGFVLYRAIKTCRKAKTSGMLNQTFDQYDRMESGLSSTEIEDSDWEDCEPSWAPDAVVLVKNGMVTKQTNDNVRKFQAPRYALHRWHSIPILMSAEHNYI